MKHSLDTFVTVSSPDRVVRSMQVTALRSQAACHCFFIERRVLSESARRLTAGRLTRIPLTQAKSRGRPAFRSTWADMLLFYTIRRCEVQSLSTNSALVSRPRRVVKIAGCWMRHSLSLKGSVPHANSPSSSRALLWSGIGIKIIVLFYDNYYH